jgi:Putative  PD-(D/E)XK family member, (DUF4420)
LNVSDLWKVLEADSPATQVGLLYRRIPGDRDIRVAVERPSNRRMLVLGVSSGDAHAGFSELPASIGFSLRAVADTTAGRVLVQLQVGQASFREVFTVLVEDVVAQVSPALSDRVALDMLLRRLVRWQAFLRATGPDGLSGEEQRGLYGELHCLHHDLIPAVGVSAAVQAWVGPVGRPQDFQLPGRSVEVKVSAAKQLQQLRISNERQLNDVPDAGTLLLMHLSIDARDTGDATLNKIVADLRSVLAHEPEASTLFEDRLFLAGYHDTHAGRYAKASYAIREQNFFRVHGEFPRITERMLPSGTGDVSYSIAVSACMPYKIGESDVRGVLEGKV